MGADTKYWGVEISQTDLEILSEKLDRFYALSHKLVQNKDLKMRDNKKCWLLSRDRKNIDLGAEMVQSKDDQNDSMHINTWFENVG